MRNFNVTFKDSRSRSVEALTFVSDPHFITFYAKVEDEAEESYGFYKNRRATAIFQSHLVFSVEEVINGEEAS